MPEGPLAIATDELTKQYPGLVALDHLTLGVPHGSVFALLGPNGAGKTTAVEILEGLRRPSGGRATVLGCDVDGAYDRIRRRVGVLPQNFEPFDHLTPAETIEYWAHLFDHRISRSAVAKSLESVGLSERARVPAGRLSGGEKRKLGIAISLVNEPEVVFLDEPTTGLDPAARRDIWSLVDGLRQAGRTVFLTTHYLDEAEKLAGDVGILHRGHLIAQGAPDELIREHAGQTTVVLVGAGPTAESDLRRVGLEGRREHNDVRVRVADPKALREAIHRIAEIPAPYGELYTERGTLDEAFLALVGSRMHEGVLTA